MKVRKSVTILKAKRGWYIILHNTVYVLPIPILYHFYYLRFHTTGYIKYSTL